MYVRVLSLICLHLLRVVCEKGGEERWCVCKCAGIEKPMRKHGVTAACRYLRCASTFASLFKVQTALQKAKPIADDAKSFAEFFRVPVSKGTKVGDCVQRYYKTVTKEMELKKDCYVMRIQEEVRNTSDLLPVLLVSFDAKSNTFYFFLVEKSSGVFSTRLEQGAGSDTLADRLVQHTSGVNQMILIPVVFSMEEREMLAPHLRSLEDDLKASGVIAVSHVDILEMILTLDPKSNVVRPPLQHGKKKLKPHTEDWFQVQWMHLRALACRADEGEPIQTINRLIAPKYVVYVVHLVRAGTRGLNIALYEPMRRRRYAAKGMLSDVLACLLERQCKEMILIPTNRTDRPTLLRCRTALIKSGRSCLLVFSSELGEKYRGIFQSEPSRHWLALREVTGCLDTDLVFKVYAAAGENARDHHCELLKEQCNGSQMVQPERETLPAVTNSEVDKWLEILSLEKRVAREQAEMEKYSKHLLVSFIATDFAAYTRPANPHSQANYVLATAMMDASGSVVEPWRKYTARGEFRLPSLNGFDVIVVHDAKHFLLLVWEDQELKKFLRRGGRVWCTMQAEYFLEAQRFQTGGNSFHTIAAKYGFVVPSSSVVGVAPVDLPLGFLRNYLISAVGALSTVFHEQLKRACNGSQLISIAHRMDSMLAMASIEWAGIHVDAKEATLRAQAIRNRVQAIDEALRLHVPNEIPVDFQRFFDWTSLHHLSALFFGGGVSLGYSETARSPSNWTTQLVQFCHRYGNLAQLSSDVHLQRFATENNLQGTGHVSQRVARFLDSNESARQRKYRLVVFDIESTGLNAATDSIVEIAAFDPVEGSSFCSLVNPERPIPKQSTAIHHITDSMVKAAPKLPEVTQAFARYLRLGEQSDSDEVIVMIGHNVFSLDEPLLRRAFNRENVSMERLFFCDSLALLKALKQELKGTLDDSKGERSILDILTTSLRLPSLVQGLRVEAEGASHRADTDSKTLWFVLVNALGLGGRDPSTQRDVVFGHAVRTLIVFPGIGCFLPQERRADCVTALLPGLLTKLMGKRELEQLRKRQLDEATLKTLHARGVEVAGLLLQKQNLERYAVNILSSGSDGRLSVLHDDSKVRQHIDLTATTTSRTTSSFPSCQNIPKDDKSSMRGLFVSRFGGKGRCVEVDYSQLEIVVMALLCNDERLVSDLRNGVDFHVKRASFFSGIPYEEIYDGYKRGIPKFVKMRKTAKIFSFQRLYGAGVPLLHKTTGIPVQDLEECVRREEEEFPGISRFHRLARTVALRANNPGLPTHFIVELPTGLRICYKTRDVVLNLPPVKNYPIQSFGAELAQMMVGRVFRHFVQKDFYGNKAFMINFVHDSLWLDCHLDVLEKCVHETKRIMEEVDKYVASAFPGVELKVPLNVTVECGMDMCSMEPLRGDFSHVLKQRRSRVEGLGLTLPSFSEDIDGGRQEKVGMGVEVEDARGDVELTV